MATEVAWIGLELLQKAFYIPRRLVRDGGSLMLAGSILLIEGNASSVKENYSVLHRFSKKLFERQIW